MGETILKMYTNFKKDSQHRKTGRYKERKLDQLKEVWDRFVELDERILGASLQIETTYETLKNAVEKAYGELYDALMLIPDEIPKSSTSNPNFNKDEKTDQKYESWDDEIERKINIQNVRFIPMRRIIDEVQTLKAAGTEVSASFCNLKIKTLTNYWERISITHEELGSFGDELPQDYMEQLENYEVNSEACMLFLQETIDKKLVPKSQEALKLPRVQIEKFLGDYFTWVSFRDLFTALAIDNKNLSNAQRMQLLKSNVGGDAETLIADLTISDADFDAAWARLKNRFENKKVIIAQYLKKLITQPFIKSEAGDAKHLKQLLDTTDQVLLSLKNLGRPVEHWDDWIVVTISHKLNEELRREWEKKVGHADDLPTWTNLKEFLEEEFRISESIENGSKKNKGSASQQIKSPLTKR